MGRFQSFVLVFERNHTTSVYIALMAGLTPKRWRRTNIVLYGVMA